MDNDKLNAFMGKFVEELGATLHAATVLTGEKLGLYRALAKGGPMTSAELARRTETRERYVREWLSAQAASGYVEYDPTTSRFSMTPEQALCLADETSPTYLPGAFLIAASLFKDEPKITEAFRGGNGVGWHEHHHDLFHGTEKFFRPGYVANLVDAWLPSLEGVVERLKAAGASPTSAAGTASRRS